MVISIANLKKNKSFEDIETVQSPVTKSYWIVLKAKVPAITEILLFYKKRSGNSSIV
jgi:hypothetical protein